MMLQQDHIIRTYRPADFDGYLSLRIEAEESELSSSYVFSQVVAEQSGWLNYSPRKDLLVLGAAEGIVGYAKVMPELAIGRVVLSCWVHPTVAGRGWGEELLKVALSRARQLRATEAHANVAEENGGLRRELTALGFRRIRLFLELRLDMSEVRWREVERAAAGCRLLQCTEIETLARIQNSSFNGSWGYSVDTPEAIGHRLGIANHYPAILVALDDYDHITGYSWTEITDREAQGYGKAKGRISMLAVAPGHRGQGVGKKVLAAALLHLRREGIEIGGLTVDAENKVARALYEIYGFKIWKRSLWYGQALDSDLEHDDRRASYGTGT